MNLKSRQSGLVIDRRMGENARRLLLSLGLLDTSRRIERQGQEVILPLKHGSEESIPVSILSYGRVVTREFETLKRRPRNIADTLSGILSEDEIKRLGRSYDIVGKILIISVPEDLYPKRQKIGRALLKWLGVETVACKISPVSGEYRVRSLEVVGGRDSLETVHRENGLRFKLDLSRVFFNPRLASERWRLGQLTAKDRRILDMFAGVGPFSITIAKASSTTQKRILAIDKNRGAIKYLSENVKLNRAKGVMGVLADSRHMVSALHDRGILFDRIIMNLPGLSFAFVESAREVLRKRGYLHYYRLLKKGEESEVIAKELGTKFKIEQIRRVGDYSALSSIFVADAVKLA